MLAEQQYWISRVNQSRRVCPEKRETGENVIFFLGAKNSKSIFVT